MVLKGLCRVKAVFLLMAVWAFLLGSNPGAAFSMPVGSQGGVSRQSRDADEKTISRFIETGIVKSRFKRLGLSEGEVIARVAKLSDQELHNLALRIDKVRSGGDGGGVALAVIIIVLIIIAILYFTDRAVKIEKKH